MRLVLARMCNWALRRDHCRSVFVFLHPSVTPPLAERTCSNFSQVEATAASSDCPTGYVGLRTIGDQQYLFHGGTGEIKTLKDGPFQLGFDSDGMGFLHACGREGGHRWVTEVLRLHLFSVPGAGPVWAVLPLGAPESTAISRCDPYTYRRWGGRRTAPCRGLTWANKFFLRMCLGVDC